MMRLAACEDKAERAAMSIGETVNFGGQTSSGTPQSLIFAPPIAVTPDQRRPAAPLEHAAAAFSGRMKQKARASPRHFQQTAPSLNAPLTQTFCELKGSSERTEVQHSWSTLLLNGRNLCGRAFMAICAPLLTD
jgi:hypothetical protein